MLILATALLAGGTLGAQGKPAAKPAAKQAAKPAALPCPDCNPPKQFWFGFGELMIAQLVPLSINNILRDAEWAKITPKTWATNLENPWQWDNNKFLNNQFSHPYHGNLYYNSGRSNGYNFWESSAVGVRRQSDVGGIRRGVGALSQRLVQHEPRRHHARGDAAPVEHPDARQYGDRQ